MRDFGSQKIGVLSIEWSTDSRLCVSAVNTMEEAIDRHVNDSLAILPVIEENYTSNEDDLRVIDVGSGAGLPGVIMAIQKEKWKV